MVFAPRPVRSTAVAMLGLAFLCASCASGRVTQLYPGDPLPEDEVATIQSWQESRYSPLGGLVVFPLTIDGVEMRGQKRDGKSYAYLVLPGAHKVGCLLLWNVMFHMEVVNSDAVMEFQAEPGHTYLTKAYAPDNFEEPFGLAPFWIEDQSTGAVVAGFRPDFISAQ